MFYVDLDDVLHVIYKQNTLFQYENIKKNSIELAINMVCECLHSLTWILNNAIISFEQ